MHLQAINQALQIFDVELVNPGNIPAQAIESIIQFLMCVDLT